MTPQAIQDWHHSMLRQEELRGSGVNDQESTIKWLSDFLLSKGVPEDMAEYRAQQAMKKMGLGALIKAITTALASP